MRTSVSRRVVFLAALLLLVAFTGRGLAEKASAGKASKASPAKTQTAKTQTAEAAAAEAAEDEAAAEDSADDATSKKKSKTAKKATAKSKSKTAGSGSASSASSAQAGSTGTTPNKGSAAVTAGGFPQLSSGAFGAAAFGSGTASGSGAAAGSGSGASGSASGSASSKNCLKTSSTSTAGDADAEAAALSDELQKLVDLTNDERRKQNLAPLTVNPILTRMAAEHSANMARLNTMSHTLEGVTFQQRLERSGYKASTAGENVAAGQTSVEQALKDWMNSPGHRANILNANFTEIGVGIAKSSAGVAYYTQEFGAPR